MAVAPTALAAVAENERLAVGHIHNDLTGGGVAHHGSGRHGQNGILGGFAVEFCLHPVAAVFRHEFAAVLVIQQSIRALVDGKDDVAAATAVAAVRSAVGHIFFAAEGHTAVAAVARLAINLYIINQHNDTSPATCFRQ